METTVYANLIRDNHCVNTLVRMGLLLATQNRGLRMRREWREHFPRQRWLAIPTCMMHVEIANLRFPFKSLARKMSLHSGHMRNPQYYVSCKWPIVWAKKGYHSLEHVTFQFDFSRTLVSNWVLSCVIPICLCGQSVRKSLPYVGCDQSH